MAPYLSRATFAAPPPWMPCSLLPNTKTIGSFPKAHHQWFLAFDHGPIGLDDIEGRLIEDGNNFDAARRQFVRVAVVPSRLFEHFAPRVLPRLLRCREEDFLLVQFVGVELRVRDDRCLVQHD